MYKRQNQKDFGWTGGVKGKLAEWNLDLSTTNLGSSIKDSPLVDRSSQSSVRVGYLYRF